MKKCKILNLVIICLVALLFISIFTNFAIADDGFTAAGFKANTKVTTDNFTSNKGKDFSNIAQKFSENSIIIMRVVGVTIAIVMLLAVAMKYMLSSAGDRADIKKHAIVYVVGAMLLFGAVGILGVIDGFTKASLQ